MSETADDLRTELDALCLEMLKAAKAEGVKLSDKAEVFKICSNHYVNVAKVKPKAATDPGGKTMADLRDQIDGKGEEHEPT